MSGQGQAGESRGRLLVVDDEEPQRLMLTGILERAGYQVVAEANGKLNQARVMPAPQAYQALEAIEVTKLQGRVYPICNFYEVFKDDELIAQLFHGAAVEPLDALVAALLEDRVRFCRGLR